MRVVEIATTDTHPLRRKELRNNDPNRSVSFPEDDDGEAVHLGVRDDNGMIVGTSTWIPRPCSEAPGRRAIQLRGMATDAALQGTGIGGLLIETAASRWAAEGFEVLWARARDSALRFYEQHQCFVAGEGFMDATTKLPHHVVVRELARRSD